jgi:hypothetical protein
MPKMVLTGGQSGTLRRGLRDAFANAYDSVAAETAEALDPVMDLGLPSDTDQEFYAYYKHAPYPRFWPRGQEVEKAGFDAVQFSVINRDYGLEVEWHKNDEADDQLGKVRDRASQTGTNFAYSPTLAFFDLLLTTTNFLPGTTNAPDGAAVFATTAGGAARFGATNGNLLTGTGVATSATITTDVFNAMEQFRLFQNTESQPLFTEAQLNGGFIVYAGAANERMFTEAFKQNPTIHSINTATSNAGVENVFMAGGKQVELRFTQKITDNDHFLFLRNCPHKPFFQQMRQPVEEQPFDEGNSKESARTLLRSMVWHERTGYGIFLPYGVIKTNN